MHDLDLCLLVIACACFAVAACGIPTKRVNIVAVGLLAAFLVPTIALLRAG